MLPEGINDAFKESRYFFTETTPDWQKLLYFTRLEDDEFIQLQTSVLSDFNSREFKELPILLHVSGMFLFHSEICLLDKSTDEIVEDVQQYLVDIFTDATAVVSENTILQINDSGSHGMEYCEHSTQNFKAIVAYMVSKVEQSLSNELEASAINLVIEITNNPEGFLSSFNRNTESNNFSRKSIFKYVDREGLFNAYLGLPNIVKRDFVSMILERYKRLNKGDKLFDEFDWLKDFIVKLNEYIRTVTPSVSTWLMQKGVERLEKIVHSASQS